MSVAALLLHHDDHREKHRWSGCFAAVVGLHAVAALLFVAWKNLTPAPEPPPPAIMIDMVPLPAPKPLPTPKPPEPKPLRKPAPKPVQKPTILKEELPVAPSEAELSAAPKPVPVQAAPTATAAPSPSPAVSAAAKASFEATLLAHLEKHKRYPPEARMRRHQGVSYLHFTMDRQGKVLSYRLYRSSGSQHLDEEVLALIVRAQPLPPIPDDRPESTLEFVVPIQFTIR